MGGGGEGSHYQPQKVFVEGVFMDVPPCSTPSLAC